VLRGIRVLRVTEELGVLLYLMVTQELVVAVVAVLAVEPHLSLDLLVVLAGLSVVGGTVEQGVPGVLRHYLEIPAGQVIRGT